MNHQNTKIQTFISVFTPSAYGAVGYSFFSAMVIFLNQFSFIQSYLQIPRDVEFIRIITTWLETVLTSTLGESRIETLVVGLFWAFVGLGVYVFLRGVAQFINDLDEGLDRRSYVWPQGSNRNSALVEAAEKVVFRLFAFIGLVLITLGPIARLLDGPVFVGFIGPSVPLQLFFWFIFLWLMLHIAVVLLRFTVLRPRLFV